jgi:hypothetical protein
MTADLRTGKLLEEVPLGGVSFSKRLNDAGTLTGAFEYDLRLASLLKPTTLPGRTALYAFRDHQAVWGGIIWQRTIDHETSTCSLQCADFWTYFDHRRLLGALTFNGLDQNAIARALVADAQAATGGSIGVTLPENASGVALDRDYKPWNYPTYASLLQDLSALEDGPDIRFDVTGTDPDVTRQLLVGTPRLGRSLDLSGIILDYGVEGAALNRLTEVEDGSVTETTHIALGPGSEASQFVGTASRADLIAAGWPLLEGLTSRSDESIGQNTIDAYAAADLAAAGGLKVTLTGTSTKLEVGTFEPGDEARIDIDAPWYNTNPAAGEVTVIPGTTGGGAYGEGAYGEGPYGGSSSTPAVEVTTPADQKSSTVSRITAFTVSLPDDGSSESVSFEFGQLLRSA